MKFIEKYRKKILYNEYTPKSQLSVARSEIEKAKFPLIDAHTHFGGHTPTEVFENRYNAADVIGRLKAVGVSHCVELTLYNKEMWDRVHKNVAGNEDFFSFCAPIDFSGYNQPNFEKRLLSEMEKYKAEGAVGFKVWKDLGLRIKKADGSRLELTDSSIGFIWEKAAELDLPVVIHVADPPAFFEPEDRFNERLEEIRKYPFWHHYRKGLVFMEYMEQLDELLGLYHETRFQVAHLCSYPGNLDYVSDLMRRHPNLYTDIAATLADIGRQPIRFRRFLTEFQDRVLFGTDYFAGSPAIHIPYFRFLETEDEYFPYSTDGTYEHGRWNIYGCKLSDELIEKIYYKNAESFFGISIK